MRRQSLYLIMLALAVSAALVPFFQRDNARERR
jgi:hypothetical protein